MTDLVSKPAGRPAATRPFLPGLLLLFVGSGCAALIYEIVWLQLLQFVIGSSAVSLGVLLGTFMGGMCLGSVALPRLISASRHPLRVYALIEVGIGVLGIVELFAVPSIAHVYSSSLGHGLPGILVRGMIGAICLLPPTLLMGATLPAIARWIETTPSGVSWLGFFYGGNIVGAVFGCLLAGFYLLRVHDMATATYVAATINAAVALAALALADRTPFKPASQDSACELPRCAPGAWRVYVTIALSGLCALSAEVIWTRVLSLMLGPTVYTFSIILAVFLVGLGIGSSAGSFLARATARPGFALGTCQILLVASMGWAAYEIARSLPYWPVDPSISTSPWFNFQMDVVRCLWAILPPTILWGASFPLALAAVASPGQDPGRLVGGVYAANTVGAIVGALGTSIVMIAWTGTQHSQQVIIVLAAVGGMLMWIPALWRSPSDSARSSGGGQFADGLLRTGLLLAPLALVILVGYGVPPIPGDLVAHGRFMATQAGDGKLLYVGEGMNASVAVTELAGGVRNFHVSGKIEASSEPQDMRLQRMLGDLPALLHPQPRSVLVVGCGAGVTAGSFVVHPSITNIVICEIEPLIPRVVAEYFGRENYNVVNDPRVTIVYDDARHFILTTQRKFDIITSDPIHPWVKGAAALYTKEYFELCRQRLNPGGLVTQWVPLYESKAEVVKSEIATFFEVFPNGTVWGNDVGGQGYDTVLLGQSDGLQINVDAVQQRLNQSAPVARSLSDVGFKSAVDLLATFAGTGSDLAPWLKDAEINRDRNLRLQYLAGMGLNSSQGGAIYTDMLFYRRFPEKLFAGSDESKEALRIALRITRPQAAR